MRTVSATRSPTDSPVPSGVMENAASIVGIVSPEDLDRQRSPIATPAPGPGVRRQASGVVGSWRGSGPHWHLDLSGRPPTGRGPSRLSLIHISEPTRPY